jgi:hypothetical protein
MYIAPHRTNILYLYLQILHDIANVKARRINQRIARRKASTGLLHCLRDYYITRPFNQLRDGWSGHYRKQSSGTRTILHQPEDPSHPSIQYPLPYSKFSHRTDKMVAGIAFPGLCTICESYWIDRGSNIYLKYRFTVASFVLLLVSTLSTPTIKSIYLFQMKVHVE